MSIASTLRWLTAPGWRRDAIFLLLALVIVLGAIWPGRTGDGRQIAYLQLVGSMGTMTIAAAGLCLLAGRAGLLSFGQGAFIAIGAYVSAYLMLEQGLGPIAALVIAVVLCAAGGAAVALATARLRGPQLAMVTLVLAVVAERFFSFAGQFGRLSGYPNPTQHGSGLLNPPEIFGVRLEPPLFAGVPATVMVALAVAVVIVVVLYRNIAQSAWGRSLAAIRESEVVAGHLGVDTFRRKVAVFALAAASGGLAGVFYAWVFAHLQPETFTFFLGVNLLIMVIFGGSRTILGPIVGAVAVTWLNDSSLVGAIVDLQTTYLSDKWYLSSQGIVGVLLILTLAVLPRGICGTLRLPRRFAAALGEPSRTPDPRPHAAADAVTGQTDDRTPVLSCESVGKSFGGLVAVADVSLRVDAGTVHALIGPNGAGKSTMANVISGVYRPDRGTIRLAGNPIAGMPMHRISRAGVSRTFQTPSLFPDESVHANVIAGFADTGTLPLWKAALKPPSQYRREAWMRTQADLLVDLVGLSDERDQEAGSLSYGKQRALEIARALASSPSLMILDEPAAGLNSAEVGALARLLNDLKASGLAMIVVEHDMGLIRAVADVVTCMNNGRVIAHGSVERTLSDPAVVRSYLGRVPEEANVSPPSTIGEVA